MNTQRRTHLMPREPTTSQPGQRRLRGAAPHRRAGTVPGGQTCCPAALVLVPRMQKIVGTRLKVNTTNVVKSWVQAGQRRTATQVVELEWTNRKPNHAAPTARAGLPSTWRPQRVPVWHRPVDARMATAPHDYCGCDNGRHCDRGDQGHIRRHNPTVARKRDAVMARFLRVVRTLWIRKVCVVRHPV
jgi:hypothetical protein